MKITEKLQANNAATYVIEGRIDTLTSPQMENVLIDSISRGIHKLTVDMKLVDYISSAGLRVFLHIAKKLQREHEQLTLRSLNPQVREVFDISGLTDAFIVEN